jgi:hypothetical protein
MNLPIYVKNSKIAAYFLSQYQNLASVDIDNSQIIVAPQ